jgi:hypothetical protein
MPDIYIFLPGNQRDSSFSNLVFIYHRYFLPFRRETISHQRFRCRSLEVLLYSFVSHCLNLCERVGWVGGGVGRSRLLNNRGLLYS